MSCLTELLTGETVGAISLGLLLFQGSASLILLSRLWKGARRHPPLKPQPPEPELLGNVSAIVPTLNEAGRLGPCLAGLSQQSYELREVIFVDSNSQDGTQEKIKRAAIKDPRFRLITDPPLPEGWVGRPWALHNGYLSSSARSEWILGIDADTRPQPGLVASLVQTAKVRGYDLVSLAPQFILKYPGEWWLQPALLVTLLYRLDSAGVDSQIPEQVMANGQCFLARRSVLEEVRGYESAASSFCDDVTLARNIASRGYKVGFLDGSQVIKVRMYEGFLDTWQGWGRSLDLKDACSPWQLGADLWSLLMVQGLPLPLTLLLLGCWAEFSCPTLAAAIALNLCLLSVRFALLLAIAPSYSGFGTPASWLFWLSPLGDPLAVVRVFLSAQTRPSQWRGRLYLKALVTS